MIIFPVTPQYLSAKGLELLLRNIIRVKKRINPSVEVDGILLTMYSERMKLSKEVLSIIQEAYRNHIYIFKSKIPNLKYDTVEFIKKEGINNKDILFQHKMKRLDIYRECFEKSIRELNKNITIYKSNRGAYESEIGGFRLNNIDILLWLEKNLPVITNRFLQLVKQR